MNRRSFLSSLPFLPSAIKASASALVAAKAAPSFDFNPQKYMGEFEWQNNAMRAQILRSIATTNPYVQVLTKS